ncbi:MAG: hypothetical protein AABY22_06070 [Nanoarchaeota archaeon]
MKKIIGLFLLPLVSAHHEGTKPVLNNQGSASTSIIAIIIFLFVILGIGYWLLKGGKKNEKN